VDGLTLPWATDRAALKTTLEGPMGKLARDLYFNTSSRPMLSWGPVPPSLRRYLEHVYGAVGDPLETLQGPILRAKTRPGPLWVAFSGGKDGLAAAVAARAEGRDVLLYHVTGINRSYPDEAEFAKQAAERVGMPLRIEKVSVYGRSGFTEMPTKNQVITALMAGRMAELGGQAYSLGVLSCDTPDTMVPDLNWSDGTEAIRLFQGYLDEILTLEFRPYLRHETESLCILSRYNLVEVAHGCMTPIRYRLRLRQTNERKYGALMHGRCGSCTKCCWEVMVLQKMGYIDRPGLYEHSVQYMTQRMKVEHPHEPTADVMATYVREDIIAEYRDRR